MGQRDEGSSVADARKRIECVTRLPDGEAHAQIVAVGGAEGGIRWSMSEEEAITAIEQRQIGLYAIVGGAAVEVVVALHLGRKYLKTNADRRDPNHLLALADCPQDGEESD
jgi:hypothetical protein